MSLSKRNKCLNLQRKAATSAKLNGIKKQKNKAGNGTL